MHHYISFYNQGGKSYVDAWIQINIFGFSFRFLRVTKQIRSEYFVERGEFYGMHTSGAIRQERQVGLSGVRGSGGNPLRTAETAGKTAGSGKGE